MERHAAFLFEIVVLPEVVVADEIVNLHAEVGEFADFAEQSREALGHGVAVLVPEVEHVAEEVDGRGLVLDGVEEVHQSPLLGAGMGNGQAAEVGIGEEIYVLHAVHSFVGL